MSRTRVLAVLAGSAVGLGVTAASAQTTGSDEQAAYRAEVAADAAGRTSLLRDDLMGDGAMFQSGSASLDIGGQIQARYILNFRDDPTGDSSDDFANGFELSRTKIWFEGDLNEDWSYRVEGDFSNARNRSNDSDGDGDPDFGNTGDFRLEDAFADWNINDNTFLRIGQFRGPFAREELVRSWNLQTPERSLVNEVFSTRIVQGVMLGYEDDQFGAYFSINDGASTANTPFLSGAESDIGLTARGEWIFAGNRDQLSDFAGWRGQDYAGLVGAAIHWQSGGETGAIGGSTTDSDTLQVTVDGQVEGSGWNVFAAGHYSNVDPASGGDRDNFGFTVQGGIFATEQIEAFGRYNVLFPESDSANAGGATFHTITFGGNYYDIPESQASKFTVGVSLFLNETTGTDPFRASPYAFSYTGLLPDDGDPQWAIIFQYQLLF